MIRTKSGQIHMSETIAVLFIFFVLIVFGMIFFFQFQKNALKEKQEEFLGQRAIDTTLRTLFMPELSCTKAGNEAEGNCIDLDKAIAAKEAFKTNKDYYFQIFSYAVIKVKVLYPAVEEIILYNNPKPDSEGVRPNVEPTFSAIVLKEEDVNGESIFKFGYITVEVYS